MFQFVLRVIDTFRPFLEVFFTLKNLYVQCASFLYWHFFPILWKLAKLRPCDSLKRSAPYRARYFPFRKRWSRRPRWFTRSKRYCTVCWLCQPTFGKMLVNSAISKMYFRELYVRKLCFEFLNYAYKKSRFDKGVSIEFVMFLDKQNKN